METESKTCIDLLKNKVISVNRNKRMSDEHFSNIGEAKIMSEKSVPLLGIKTDNKLSFENQSFFSAEKQATI